MNDLDERLRRAGDHVAPSDQPYERLLRRRDRRRRRERLMAGGVGLVLVVGVFGGLLAVFTRTAGRDDRPGASSNGRANAPALAPGQDMYRRTTIVTPDGNVVLETWWATDESGRVAASCTIPDCRDSYGPPPAGTFGAGQFPTDDDVSGLSTDASVLEGQLLARSAEGGSSPRPAFSPGPEVSEGVTAGGLWDAIANILDDNTGTPELRAALFDVASGIPGVEVQTGVTDPGGRPATALILRDSANGPAAMYFDPATKQVLAEGAEPGQPTSTWYTVYDEGIVDGIDNPPTGDQWLFPEASPKP
jgi:hypothetical protein